MSQGLRSDSDQWTIPSRRTATRCSRWLLCAAWLTSSSMAAAGGLFIPFLNCVDDGRDPDASPLFAVIGYINMGPEFTIPADTINNFFDPSPRDRGQPGTFETGAFASAFRAEFDEVTPVVWTIGDQQVSFDRDSLRCEPPLLEDEVFDDGFEEQSAAN